MFALSPMALTAAIQADADSGLVPLFLCVSVRTTTTTAIDPVPKLYVVAAAHGVWVHVEAAYAGSTFICPEFRHRAEGVQEADSISMNLLGNTLERS